MFPNFDLYKLGNFPEVQSRFSIHFACNPNTKVMDLYQSFRIAKYILVPVFEVTMLAFTVIF